MTEQAIYLASVADKSYLNPAGGLKSTDSGGDYVLQGMFDKVGVKPVNFRVGQYKVLWNLIFVRGYEREKQSSLRHYMQCTDYMYTKIGDRGISKKRLTRF
jgi:protease-4